MNQYYNPYQQSNIDWIMVQSIDQVESIAVQPNRKAWVMVQNEPIFALRTADAMGLVTTELYKFEKYERPQTKYVTADQLNDIIDQLKGEIHESIISATETASEPSKPRRSKTDAPND